MFFFIVYYVFTICKYYYYNKSVLVCDEGNKYVNRYKITNKITLKRNKTYYYIKVLILIVIHHTNLNSFVRK